MQLRTARLLASVGALTLATTLTSCGFDYATNRVYTPANGANERDASVDVLGAVVVSAQEGSGTFIATFANNNADEEATVTGLEGGGENPVEAETFQPIELPGGGAVNLATEGGIPVTGDFAAGDFLTVTVTLGGGESVELDVPTVTDCGFWEGLDTSGGGSSTAASSDEQCDASGAPEEE